MTIGAVHTALASLLAALSITSPITQTIVKAWPYTPPVTTMMQPFSWIVWHDLTGVEFQPGGLVTQQYDMRVQFFGMEAAGQADIAATVANAFLDKLVTALSEHVRLSGAVQVVRGFRGAGGGGGTLAVLPWSGKNYVGLDLIVPITLTDTRTRGA